MSFLSEKWHNIFYENADPRTRDFPLMGSPTIIIALEIFYVILIKIILEMFMRDRKPYNIRYVSLVLNSYLFATACYFFYRSCRYGWFTRRNWFCEPLDRSNSEDAIEVIKKSLIYDESRIIMIVF